MSGFAIDVNDGMIAMGGVGLSGVEKNAATQQRIERIESQEPTRLKGLERREHINLLKTSRR